MIVATVSQLGELGRRYVPQLHARLASLDRFFGTEHEHWALRPAYALAPAKNFSRDVLEPAQGELRVSHMPTLTWSDLGTPQRVLRAVRQLDSRPPWLHPSRVAPESGRS